MTVPGDALSMYCNSFSIMWADLLEKKALAVILKNHLQISILIFFSSSHFSSPK